jgi:hypothetical protein
MTTRQLASPRLAGVDRTLGFAAVAVLGVVVGLFAGILAGGSMKARQEPPAAVRVVQAGKARLAVPAEWQPATLRSAAVAGLDPLSTVAFQPYPGTSDRALAMLAPADHPSLIPSTLRHLLGALPRHPVAARLAGWPAWRYPPMLPRVGNRTVSITVMPTTRGVLAVACVSSVTVAYPGCALDVKAVSVADAAPLVPSTAVALGLELPAALRRLDRARVTGRSALEHARSPAAQAAAARRLAHAYSSTAKSLLTGAGEAAASLAKRLDTAGRAYAHLGQAASDSSTARFDAARRGVDVAEATVVRTVAQIRRTRLLQVAPAPRGIAATDRRSETSAR